MQISPTTPSLLSAVQSKTDPKSAEVFENKLQKSPYVVQTQHDTHVRNPGEFYLHKPGEVHDVLELSPEAEKIMKEGRKELSLLEQREASRKHIKELAENIENIYLEKTPEMISGEQFYTELSFIGGTVYRAEIESSDDRWLRSTFESLNNNSNLLENVEGKIAKAEEKMETANWMKKESLILTISMSNMVRGSATSAIQENLKSMQISFERHELDQQYARNHILELSGGNIDINELYEKYLGDEA